MECIDCRGLFVPSTTFSTSLFASKSLKVPPFNNAVNTNSEGKLLTAICPATNTTAVARDCELVLFNTNDDTNEKEPLELEFESVITALCWDKKGVFVHIRIEKKTNLLRLKSL